MKGTLQIVPGLHKAVAKHPRLYRTILLFQVWDLDDAYKNKNVHMTNQAFRHFLKCSSPRINFFRWVGENRLQLDRYGALTLCAIRIDIMRACGRKP